jgi:peptidoglycan hydrolase CwlO-like protein
MEFFWQKIKRLEKEKSDLQKSVNNLIQMLDDEMGKTDKFREENQKLRHMIVDAAKNLKAKEEDFKATIEFMKLENLQE